ncbi:binding partner of ACD11 1 isoform X1 [Elaeis guineensis]|uniref:binding partner of ACD11 1 isoform X1 n=1 Tax=Elaeis guineensis var. tenera TaxID=51953 RepID=UPI003C6DB418
MGALNLTVQVLNISPKASREDLLTFFSYCGTVAEIQLQRDKDKSQLAFVTFRQPYALQTALLLNDVPIIDRQVRILPLDNMKNIPINSCTSDSMNSKKYSKIFSFSIKHLKSIDSFERDREGSLPAADVVQALASKSHEALSSAKEQVSATGRILTKQANSAISAAEQSVGNIRSAVMNNNYFSKGALWLSDVLDKASKSMAELANVEDRDMTSGKQK